MEFCQECNLPIKVCNAIVYWRKMAEVIRSGKLGGAIELGNEAEDWYRRYMESPPVSDPNQCHNGRSGRI